MSQSFFFFKLQVFLEQATAEIIPKWDIHRTDTKTTCLIAHYKRKDGHWWLKEARFYRLNHSDYGRLVHTFYLKWHPNFLRRWLFRLFKI